MEHEFYIAGVQHHEYKQCLDFMEDGINLKLIPEPENIFDPNAVRIIYSYESDDATMLGYVPAKLSPSVLAMIEIFDNVECTLTTFNKDSKPWEMFQVTIKPTEVD